MLNVIQPVLENMFKTVTDCQIHWRKLKWMNERAKKSVSYEPTNLEHYANTVSHGIMIIPSILAGELLLWSYKCQSTVMEHKNDSLSYPHDSPTGLHYEVSARIYGGCLVGLFLVSTVFHWLTWCKTDHATKTVKLSDNCCGSQLWEFFHLCDRAIIFIFISGSYTPWLMLTHVPASLEWLRWGMWLYGGVGIVYSSVLLEKYKLLETLLYIVQGLLPALAIVFAVEGTPLNSLSVGGVFYLLGVLVFKSDGYIPCAHAIWHMFVAAGAVSHFAACYAVLYT